MRKAMERSERAKQFMPFAALEGLESSLYKRTQHPQERIILAEDAQTELDMRLRSLAIGERVLATHYMGMGYVETEGILRRIDPIDRSITVDELVIKLSALLDIRGEL